MISPVRVIIVDDSALMRRLLADLLEKDPGITVVGTARNGVDALATIKEKNPDVVTMDIEMPKMDGLTALQHIMDECPMPVVMVSAMAKRQADITMKALDLGAVDFISKTSGALSLDIEKAGRDIINKIKTAAKVKVKSVRKTRIEPISFRKITTRRDNLLVVIGASTGGPKAIPEVLSRLPLNIPAGIVMVQHMPGGFTRSFAERLNWYTSLEVKEAEDGDKIKPGLVLMAPGDYHMVVDGTRVRLNQGPKINYVRPAVDLLMESAARSHGASCVGVILTGMGSDGAKGMKEIKSKGGRTVVQERKSCVVFGMPKAAIDIGAADRVVPLSRIGDEIIAALEG